MLLHLKFELLLKSGNIVILKEKYNITSIQRFSKISGKILTTTFQKNHAFNFNILRESEFKVVANSDRSTNAQK